MSKISFFKVGKIIEPVCVWNRGKREHAQDGLTEALEAGESEVKTHEEGLTPR